MHQGLLPFKREGILSLERERQRETGKEIFPSCGVIPYRALTFSMLIFSGKTVMQR